MSTEGQFSQVDLAFVSTPTLAPNTGKKKKKKKRKQIRGPLEPLSVGATKNQKESIETVYGNQKLVFPRQKEETSEQVKIWKLQDDPERSLVNLVNQVNFGLGKDLGKEEGTAVTLQPTDLQGYQSKIKHVRFHSDPIILAKLPSEYVKKGHVEEGAGEEGNNDAMASGQRTIYTNLIEVGEGKVVFSKEKDRTVLSPSKLGKPGNSKGPQSSQTSKESFLGTSEDSELREAREGRGTASNHGTEIVNSLSPDTVDTISAQESVCPRNGDSSSSGFTPKEPWDLHMMGSPLQDGYHADIEDQNVDKTTSANGSSEPIQVRRYQASDSSNSKDHVDYRELAIKLAVEYCRPKTAARRRKYCDFVLVYDAEDTDLFHRQDRDRFEKQLHDEGIDIIRTEIGKYCYVELYSSFARLCEEAENVFLQMPLAGFSVKEDDSRSLSSCLSILSGEHEPAYVTLPFCNSVLELFQGVDDPESFFRPALRSMLTENILQSIKTTSCEEASEDGVKNVAALSSLLHSRAYKDAYILHERSQLDPLFPMDFEKLHQSQPPSIPPDKKKPYLDRRQELQHQWLTWYRFQPLTKVKDYFGEKIAFYFAWLGMLITSLWIPTLLGLAVFFFGLMDAYNTAPEKYAEIDVMAVKRLTTKALDSKLTPYFALMICLWGTVFLEIWKRKSAELAYKWDVDDFEFQEPNRPQFYGVRNIKDPISGTFEPFYPPIRKVCKSLGSMSVVLFMILLVLGSVISVITVKVISRVDWFSGDNGSFVASLMASVLNSISILLLGKFYRSVAVTLTCWENHRTQTQYEDALILKLFGFQFVNSYSSLYYIAFFRERTSSGIFEKGPAYTDDCGNTNDCMSLLSLQVAVLMLMKPLPKFLGDYFVPKVKQAYRLLRTRCKRNAINITSDTIKDEVDPDVEYEDYLVSERQKPSLSSFTLSEYTEKVIEYGYLMLFAAAFPLAPLIALVTNLVDLRVDARRLLWLNRRPVAQRAQDIGMWYTILEFLNYVGVVTNAFLIGLTSTFGRNYSTVALPRSGTNETKAKNVAVASYANLWIVIIFQNIVLAVKFFVAYVIPDVPDQVFRAQKKEKQEVERLLAKAGFRKGPKKTIAPASTSSSGDRRRADKWRKSGGSTFSDSRRTSITSTDPRQRMHWGPQGKSSNTTSA